MELEDKHRHSQEAKFIIRPTSVLTRKHLINWAYKGKQSAKLKIKYINKRRIPLPAPRNLKATVENGKVKLSWDKLGYEDLVGYFVVRNRWNIPKSPFDGVKLYAGIDNYTYDTYGSTKMNKYYAVFSYDDVPNYSESTVVAYQGNSK